MTHLYLHATVDAGNVTHVAYNKTPLKGQTRALKTLQTLANSRILNYDDLNQKPTALMQKAAEDVKGWYEARRSCFSVIRDFFAHLFCMTTEYDQINSLVDKIKAFKAYTIHDYANRVFDQLKAYPAFNSCDEKVATLDDNIKKEVAERLYGLAVMERKYNIAEKLLKYCDSDIEVNLIKTYRNSNEFDRIKALLPRLTFGKAEAEQFLLEEMVRKIHQNRIPSYELLANYDDNLTIKYLTHRVDELIARKEFKDLLFENPILYLRKELVVNPEVVKHINRYKEAKQVEERIIKEKEEAAQKLDSKAKEIVNSYGFNTIINLIDESNFIDTKELKERVCFFAYNKALTEKDLHSAYRFWKISTSLPSLNLEDAVIANNVAVIPLEDITKFIDKRKLSWLLVKDKLANGKYTYILPKDLNLIQVREYFEALISDPLVKGLDDKSKSLVKTQLTTFVETLKAYNGQIDKFRELFKKDNYHTSIPMDVCSYLNKEPNINVYEEFIRTL